MVHNESVLNGKSASPRKVEQFLPEGLSFGPSEPMLFTNRSLRRLGERYRPAFACQQLTAHERHDWGRHLHLLRSGFYSID